MKHVILGQAPYIILHSAVAFQSLENGRWLRSWNPGSYIMDIPIGLEDMKVDDGVAVEYSLVNAKDYNPAGSLTVVGPLTDIQLRAAPVPVTLERKVATFYWPNSFSQNQVFVMLSPYVPTVGTAKQLVGVYNAIAVNAVRRQSAGVIEIYYATGTPQTAFHENNYNAVAVGSVAVLL